MYCNKVLFNTKYKSDLTEITCKTKKLVFIFGFSFHISLEYTKIPHNYPPTQIFQFVFFRLPNRNSFRLSVFLLKKPYICQYSQYTLLLCKYCPSHFAGPHKIDKNARIFICRIIRTKWKVFSWVLPSVCTLFDQFYSEK